MCPDDADWKTTPQDRPPDGGEGKESIYWAPPVPFLHLPADAPVLLGLVTWPSQQMLGKPIPTFAASRNGGRSPQRAVVVARALEMGKTKGSQGGPQMCFIQVVSYVSSLWCFIPKQCSIKVFN